MPNREATSAARFASRLATAGTPPGCDRWIAGITRRTPIRAVERMPQRRRVMDGSVSVVMERSTSRAQRTLLRKLSARRPLMPLPIHLDVAASGRVMAHLLEPPGLGVRFPSREDMARALPGPLDAHLAWLRGHGAAVPAGPPEDGVAEEIV